MIQLTVPGDESLEVQMAGYSLRFYVNSEGKLVFTRNIGDGYRELVLDPVDDAIPRNPGDVPLDQNLTEKRLPALVQDAKTLRVVVWDRDADTGHRMVHDIVEGTQGQIIRFFNKRRGHWIDLGCDPTARLEVVREEREGIWA